MLDGSEWQDEDLVLAQPNRRPIDKKTAYDDWSRCSRPMLDPATGDLALVWWSPIIRYLAGSWTSEALSSLY